MKKNPSLERRLLVSLTALYAISLIVVVLAYLAVTWITHGIEIVDMTNETAGEIVEALRSDPGHDHVIVDPESDIVSEIASIPDVAYAVEDAASGRRLVTAGDVSAASDLAHQGWEVSGKFTGHNGAVRFVAIQTRQSAVGPVRIVFERGGITPRDFLPWIGDELWEETLPVMIPVFIVSLLVVLIVARRTLLPLRLVSAMASEIGRGRESGVRLDDTGVPQEILPLIHAVNAAFDRVKSSLIRQKRFTANAAHELRTPLAVLRVCIDNLTMGAVKQELVAETDRLSRRVNQLLALARLEDGKIDFSDLDLNQLVGNVTRYLVPLAMERKRSLAFQAASGPVTITGNRFAVEDAVRNLIENAIRHTPAGTTVEVSLNQDAVLEIRDHGSGVPTEMMQKIFEPFWRADSQLGDGAGLGLAIVRETATLHEGEITVANHPEGGAVFSATFRKPS